MLTDDQKYMIRELNSFNYLHFKLSEITEKYAKTLDCLENKIAIIEAQLSEYHVPSLKYDYMYDASVHMTKNNRVIELIMQQEQLINKVQEKKSIQKKEVEKIVIRIDDINTKLRKLDVWEREYIWNMYIKPKGIDYMMDNYNYSKKSIYNIAYKILKKMLYD